MSTEQTPIALAIEALKKAHKYYSDGRGMRGVDPILMENRMAECDDALAALRTLTPDATGGGGPVAWMRPNDNDCIPAAMKSVRSYYTIPLYTHPPKPEQPRLDDELAHLVHQLTGNEGDDDPIKVLRQYVEHRPRVELTDDEIGRLASKWIGVGHDHAAMSAFATGAKYARDNGYLTPAKPFTVDEVMKEFDEELPPVLQAMGWGQTSQAYTLLRQAVKNLRARLTQKFKTDGME